MTIEVPSLKKSWREIFIIPRMVGDPARGNFFLPFAGWEKREVEMNQTLTLGGEGQSFFFRMADGE